MAGKVALFLVLGIIGLVVLGAIAEWIMTSLGPYAFP